MVRRFLSHSDYDVVLNPPNERNMSMLTLLVRVHLNPIFPPDFDQKEASWDDEVVSMRKFKCQRWNPAEWESFKIGYKREVESFLNWPTMGLWLLPASFGHTEFHEEMKEFINLRPISKRFRPTVQCGFSVTIVPTENQSHVHYGVLRLKDNEDDFREYDINRFYRRDRGILTNRALMPWPPRTGHVPQSVVSHELGHALNLDHSNINDPKCVKGDEDICYGRPGTWQYDDLMGAGNTVHKADATPWLRAIYWLTTWSVWRATAKDPKEMWFSA